MRRLILVSATTNEIQPALLFLEQFKTGKEFSYQLKALQINVCITGVGMVNTAFNLGRLGNENYLYALNAGVCGSFKEHPEGTVLNVLNDRFAELGAEDDEKFITVDDLGLGIQEVSVEKPLITMAIKMLGTASGISVNTVHGNEKTIQNVISLFHPEIESMEGAAFIMAANSLGWEAVQLRAVSNRVEKRNRESWNMPLAIKNLNDVVIELLKELSSNSNTESYQD